MFANRDMILRSFSFDPFRFNFCRLTWTCLSIALPVRLSLIFLVNKMTWRPSCSCKIYITNGLGLGYTPKLYRLLIEQVARTLSL